MIVCKTLLVKIDQQNCEFNSFKVVLITSEAELLILNYYLLCYFNATMLLLNQMITMSLKGNHEYNTRSINTINADPPTSYQLFPKLNLT